MADTPRTDDNALIEQAADRAKTVLPEPIGRLVRRRLISLLIAAGDTGRLADEREELARAILTLPVPVPAVDRGGPPANVITEHAIEMSGGGMHVRYQDPEIERIFPLAEWIPAHQRFGGKVWRRRIRVVEDWVEEPKGAGGDHA